MPSRPVPHHNKEDNKADSEETTETREVSVETVNSQIKSILSKTGCSKRSEIPNLMRMYLSL